MTPQEAKKMLQAKLECLKNETSGINHDCNMRLCDGCSLNYEQGNMGEQKEALQMAIKALESQPKTGHWIFHKPFDNGCKNCNECIECSQCHIWLNYDFYAKTPYCPNCGADMRGEDNGE